MPFSLPEILYFVVDFDIIARNGIPIYEIDLVLMTDIYESYLSL